MMVPLRKRTVLFCAWVRAALRYSQVTLTIFRLTTAVKLKIFSPVGLSSSFSKGLVEEAQHAGLPSPSPLATLLLTLVFIMVSSLFSLIRTWNWILESLLNQKYSRTRIYLFRIEEISSPSNGYILHQNHIRTFTAVWLQVFEPIVKLNQFSWGLTMVGRNQSPIIFEYTISGVLIIRWGNSFIRFDLTRQRYSIANLYRLGFVHLYTSTTVMYQTKRIALRAYDDECISALSFGHLDASKGIFATHDGESVPSKCGLHISHILHARMARSWKGNIDGCYTTDYSGNMWIQVNLLWPVGLQWCFFCWTFYFWLPKYSVNSTWNISQNGCGNFPISSSCWALFTISSSISSVWYAYFVLNQEFLDSIISSCFIHVSTRIHHQALHCTSVCNTSVWIDKEFTAKVRSLSFIPTGSLWSKHLTAILE